MSQVVERTKIPVFSGADEALWRMWKEDMLGVFFALNEGDINALDIVEGTTPRPEDGDRRVAWDKVNKALYFRALWQTTRTAKEIVNLAGRAEGGYDGLAAWQALLEKFERGGSARLGALHKQLLDCRFRADMDPDPIFNRAEDLQRQIGAMGVIVDNATIQAILIHNLEERLRPLVMMLDQLERVQPKDQLTKSGALPYEVFKDSVRTHYARHQWGSAGGGGGAKADRPDSALHASDVPTRKGKCRYCGKPNHWERECKKKQRDEAAQAAGSRGAGGRGGAAEGRRAQGPSGKASVSRTSESTRVAQVQESIDDDCEDYLACMAMERASVVHGERHPRVWMIDSGCTSHMTDMPELLVDIVPNHSSVTVGGGRCLPATGVGRLLAYAIDTAGRHVHFELSRVLIVPGLGCNLISVSYIEAQGGEVHHAGSGGRYIRPPGPKAPTIPLSLRDRLYWVDLPVRSGGPSEAVFTATDRKADLWHQRLGHHHMGNIRRLGGLDVGVPPGLKLAGPCDACEVNKHTHRSHARAATHRAMKPFALVHADLVGPFEEVSVGGSRYFLLFTCDHTRWRMIYFLARKSDASDKLPLYLDEVKRLTGGAGRVLAIRSDRGGEFVGDSFQAHCAKHGITFQSAGPDAPQQNGVAERSNRIVQDMMRSMREAAGLSKPWWAEAANTAVYIINRVPTRALGGDTPYHALHGEHASLRHIRVFGCRAYVQVPKTQRRKLDDRAWRGILVGYDPINPTCYKVWDPESGRIRPSVHVTFDERCFPARMLTDAPPCEVDAPDLEAPPAGVVPAVPAARTDPCDAVQVPAGPEFAPQHESAAPPASPTAASPVGGSDDQEPAQVPAVQPQAVHQQRASGPSRTEEPARRPRASATVGAQEPGRRSQRQEDRRVKAAAAQELAERQQVVQQQPRPLQRERSRVQQLVPVPERRSSRLARKAGAAEAGASQPMGDVEPVRVMEPGEPGEPLVHGAHLSYQEVPLAAAHTSGDPVTYEQAMQSPYAAEWTASLKAELKALEENNTWTLCERPPGARVIGSRWHFKTKRDQTGAVSRFKTRLVAQGYHQIEGLDFLDSYAPTAKPESFRAVIGAAAVKNWELDSMDVISAFLQADLEDEVVYIRQPPGFEVFDPGGKELVCRLKKSLYGLKQSPRAWNKVIDGWMRQRGFKPSHADPCVYVRRTGKDVLIVVLYVDDLLIAGSRRDVVDEFKAAISDRFQMKDLGPVEWILGMQVVRDRRARTIELKQTAYIDSILERFGMQNCKPVATPSEGELQRGVVNSAEGEAAKYVSNDSEYRRLVGCLMYAAVMTRPDIAYAVQVLSRHLQAVGDEQRRAGKRLLRYLKGTRELGIIFGINVGEAGIKLEGYCDSTWGGAERSRSTTGYIFKSGGGPVSWSSRLQPSVALSSTEAEYMALGASAQEVVHLRQLFSDLTFEQEAATVIFEDNQGCIAWAENPVVSKRSKHIAIKYHFTRELVEDRVILLRYIATEHQIADLLTKDVVKDRVLKLRACLHGYE